ncbi:hypothetical protein OHQ88_23455 [Micromonospora zamorensis]|uniref:hypothetical protein n=1 Tax=Micromonospora zamorensis TaxID=709883 RepID=UPI002E23D97F
MNEDEFRGALRDVMATTSPPPPMSAADTLAAGRRARFRRRVVSFCAGSATAVVLVAAVGFTGVLGSGSSYRPAGTEPPSNSAADPRATTPPGAVRCTPASCPHLGSPDLPQEEWDARNNRAREMLDDLIAALPAGYTVVRDDPLNPLDPKAFSLGFYQAYFNVRQGKQTGLVIVEVHTPQSPIGNRWQGNGCDLALEIWPPRGTCQLMTASQAKVGVAQARWNEDPPRFAQWAVYRHPDGVLVKVVQISRPDRYWTAPPELKKLPFTAQQLADLAVSDQFHVDVD